MSGTLSETSQASSVREVTFLKAEDQTKILEERLVLTTTTKIPFYVTSCIPYHKSSKTTRWVSFKDFLKIKYSEGKTCMVAIIVWKRIHWSSIIGKNILQFSWLEFLMYFCNILAMRIACLMKGMAHTVCVQEFDWFINTFHIFFGNCNFLCWYWIEFSLVAIFFRHKVNWLDFRCVENYFGDFLFCNCPKMCKFIWVVDCTFLLMKCWLKCLDF